MPVLLIRFYVGIYDDSNRRKTEVVSIWWSFYPIETSCGAWLTDFSSFTLSGK